MAVYRRGRQYLHRGCELVISASAGLAVPVLSRGWHCRTLRYPLPRVLQAELASPPRPSPPLSLGIFQFWLQIWHMAFSAGFSLPILPPFWRHFGFGYRFGTQHSLLASDAFFNDFQFTLQQFFFGGMTVVFNHKALSSQAGL